MKNNMKTIKRLASISAALVMAATSVMSFASFADSAKYTEPKTDSNVTKGTIEIANSNTEFDVHSYSAYQIFKGTYGDGVLANIDWGTGVNSEGLVGKLHEKISAISADATANDVATWLADSARTDAEIKAFQQVISANLSNTKVDSQKSGATEGSIINTTATISNLADGYYLVKDNDAASGGDAKSRDIMTTVGGDNGIKATQKNALTQVEKKVQEGDAWQDVADATVTDEVRFKLKATLPENLDDYTKFYIKFNDTLDLPGFELTSDNKADIVVKSAKIIDKNDSTKTKDLTVKTTEHVASGEVNEVLDTAQSDKVTFSFEIQDILSIKDESGEKAFAQPGSTVEIEYTAKLANGAIVTPTTGNDNAVTLEYSNNPNEDMEGKDKPDSLGETPKDVVTVLTYELDWDKVAAELTDGNHAALTGAKFKLSRMNDTTTEEWYTETDGVITWKSGKDAEGNAKVIVAEEGTNNYKLPGVDAGTYKLYETEAPAGRNLPSTPFEITISRTFTTTAKENLTERVIANSETEAKRATPLETLKIQLKGNDEADGNTSTGVVKTNIENGKGTELPSTGGIGTKIFLAGGGTLVLGAGVTLIAKKRMKNKE